MPERTASLHLARSRRSTGAAAGATSPHRRVETRASTAGRDPAAQRTARLRFYISAEAAAAHETPLSVITTTSQTLIREPTHKASGMRTSSAARRWCFELVGEHHESSDAIVADANSSVALTASSLTSPAGATAGDDAHGSHGSSQHGVDGAMTDDDQQLRVMTPLSAPSSRDLRQWLCALHLAIDPSVATDDYAAANTNMLFDEQQPIIGASDAMSAVAMGEDLLHHDEGGFHQVDLWSLADCSLAFARWSLSTVACSLVIGCKTVSLGRSSSVVRLSSIVIVDRVCWRRSRRSAARGTESRSTRPCSPSTCTSTARTTSRTCLSSAGS